MLRILRRLRDLSGSWESYRLLAFVLRRLIVQIGLLVFVAPIALLARPVQSLLKNKPIFKTDGRSIVIELLLAGNANDAAPAMISSRYAVGAAGTRIETKSFCLPRSVHDRS